MIAIDSPNFSMKNALILASALALCTADAEAKKPTHDQIRKVIAHVIEDCAGEIIDVRNRNEDSRIFLMHNDREHECPERSKILRKIVDGCRITRIECTQKLRGKKCPKFYADIECEGLNDNWRPRL